jgi:hypothetical protein
MFKRLFQSHQGESDLRIEEPAPAEASPADSRPPAGPAPAFPANFDLIGANQDSFDEVYDHAAVKPPSQSFGILKVAAMAASPYLAGMTAESKRSSILMALEAAGADLGYLLEDAVFRQRALDEREDLLQKRLAEFEAAKANEIAAIQAELARITAQSMARIQHDREEVAREQERLRLWQSRKQQESQRIADTAMFFAPQSVPAPAPQSPPSTMVHDGFAAMLERGAAASRR